MPFSKKSSWNLIMKISYKCVHFSQLLSVKYETPLYPSLCAQETCLRGTEKEGDSKGGVQEVDEDHQMATRPAVPGRQLRVFLIFHTSTLYWVHSCSSRGSFTGNLKVSSEVNHGTAAASDSHSDDRSQRRDAVVTSRLEAFVIGGQWPHSLKNIGMKTKMSTWESQENKTEDFRIKNISLWFVAKWNPFLANVQISFLCQ